GEIDYIYPELDPKTRTLPVRLRFDNSEGLLRPNMFGTVSLVPGRTRTALTVPSEAVIRTGSAERVILKTGEGTFKPRLVTSGLRDNFGEGGRTEIVQGLAPGEEVVASAQFLIDSESALSAGLMRMAPTDEAPARGTGRLVTLDRENRLVTIRHGPLDSLDWPAMTSVFPVRADVPLDHLGEESEIAFTVARGADNLLALIEIGADDGVAATGTGTIHAVNPDGTLTVSHDPIPALGWPAMEMEFEVAGLGPETVVLDSPVEFDLAKDDTGMFSIVAVREKAATAAPASGETAMAEAAPIVVRGTIDAVDPAARTATISHGPMTELGMPGMTMDFSISEELEPAALVTGTETTLTFVRPDGMTLLLADAEPVIAPMKVAGIINSTNPDRGMVNITHDAMVELGMPGMTMDFAVDDALDQAILPIGERVSLLFRRNPDFSLTLVGIATVPEVS
uniref:efflux RND transporter periplasmic adaptor subunit n=1 Tax=Leisingera sp. F5 TaxID=1813816 RepID=UPI000B01428C